MRDDDDDDFAATELDPSARNVRPEPELPSREAAAWSGASASVGPPHVSARREPEAGAPAFASEPSVASTLVLPSRPREADVDEDDAGVTELDRPEAFAPIQPPHAHVGWKDSASRAGAPARAPQARAAVVVPRRVPDSDLGLKLALGGLVALIVLLVGFLVVGLASVGDDDSPNDPVETSE